jgi:hypothetical protein
LHEAGIETGSPLGSILLQQFDSTATAGARLDAATRAVEGARSDAIAELAFLKQQLQEGYRQVSALQQSGETHLRFQEKLLEQERQSAIHRFVFEISRDIKQVLFKELKEKLPFDEKKFMIFNNGRNLFLAFMAAGLMVGFGYWVGLRHSDKIFALGEVCQRHLRHDPVKNFIWCEVTTPDAPAAGQGG